MIQIIRIYLLKFLIIFTPRVILPYQGNIGVTTLIGHAHTDMYIFSLKSFFYSLNIKLPVCLVDDGTLTIKDITKIRNHFKNIDIKRRESNEYQVKKRLSKYKYCSKYRNENFKDKFYIKLFDPFIVTKFNKIIYLDYDIIFLNRPREIETWIKTDNKDYGLYATEYTYGKINKHLQPEWRRIGEEFAKAVSKKFQPDFNSGLLILPRSKYNLDTIEKSLKYIYREKLEDTWVPEQYSFGVIFAEMKSLNLKGSYLHLTGDVFKLDKNLFEYTCLHFAYRSKRHFYKIAINVAFKTRFFSKFEYDQQ